MYYTTLKSIKVHRPCEKGWKKLLWHLHKTRADDKPLSLLDILESNGIQDAIWALRAVDDPACERDARIFAVRCVRQLQHLLSNEQSLKALDVAEKYACGEASNEELAAAQDAAWAAAQDAAWAAAHAAAWEAAWEVQGKDFREIFCS